MNKYVNDLTAVQKVNALEAPWQEDAQAPESWTINWLMARFGEYGKTLLKLPPVRGPRQPGGHWPAFPYEKDDLAAQAENTAAELAASFFVRRNATSRELTRFDEVEGWIEEMRKFNRRGADLLLEISYATAKCRIDQLAADRGMNRSGLMRRRENALESLLAWLIKTGIPVS